MEQIKEISSIGFKIVKSTSKKLIGYQIIDEKITVGKKLKLKKEDKYKSIFVDTIIKVNDKTYHILNSNIGIIIKKI